jgi:drug/metabolite transporter (DMT)-like permease
MRWSASAASFFVLAWIFEGGIRASRADVLRLTGLGLVGVTLTQLANVYSLHFAPASTVSIVFGLMPVIMALVGGLAGIDRLTGLQWLGVAASCMGVALIAIGRGDVGGDLVGILLAVCTVTGFSVYSVLLVPIARRTSPLTVNALSLAVPAALLSAIASGQYARQDWSAPDGLAWAGVAYAALGGIVAGNGLWFVALKRVGPGRAGVYGNLQPVFGVLFAIVLLSETLHALEIAGAAVIALGIALARRRARTTPSVTPGQRRSARRL